MTFKRFNYSYGNDNSANSATLEAGTLVVNSSGALVLHDGTTAGGKRVDTGSMQFDNSGDMYTAGSNIDIYTDNGGPNYAEVWMLGNTHVSITADGETNSWLFKAGGALQLPGSVTINANVTTNTGSGVGSVAGVPVTVWTASSTSVTAAQVICRSNINYGQYTELLVATVVKNPAGNSNVTISGQTVTTDYSSSSIVSGVDGDGKLYVTAAAAGGNDANFLVSVTEFY